MKMKKGISLALILLAMVFTTMQAGCIYYGVGEKGNGNVVKEDRKVDSFHQVKVSGAFEVYVTQGSSEALTVEADENLMEMIKTKVVGGMLKIYTEGSIRKSTALRIYLTIRDLDFVGISGAVEFKSKGTLNLDELAIHGSGATDVELNLKVKELELEVSGASELELSGTADEFDFEASGASELYAFDLVAEEVSLDISGAAEAKVHATRELSIEASGAASVKYKGNPSVEQDISGAASVKNY